MKIFLKPIKMKLRVILIAFFAILFNNSRAQVIQCTIKPGVAANEVAVFIKPDFTVPAGTDYLFQLQFPVAWSSGLIPIPTGLQVTVDPAFTAFFGTYNTVVYPLSSNLATNDRYYVISMNRTVSTFTNWISGTEYPVLTAKFTSVLPAPSGQVKVADYLSGGGDGQGNFYTLGGVSGTYFVALTSTGNFYPTAAMSVVGGSASDGYVQTLANIVLPIDLLTFSGYKDGTRNQLKWTTSTEQNNSGFEVQRSLNGVNYSPIGFVNSIANGGNSTVQLNYTFTDNNVTGLRQYYRLRQVDLGGYNRLSNVVLIKSDRPTMITIDGIFPNPATTTINILVGAPVKDKVSIVVTDMAGRIMITKNMNVETGSNTLPLDVSRLAGGNYFIKMVDSNGEVVSGKFVKN